jgi:hypothetical protein
MPPYKNKSYKKVHAQLGCQKKMSCEILNGPPIIEHVLKAKWHVHIGNSCLFHKYIHY